MARVSKLFELFRSIGDGEVDRARQLGEAICLAEEKRGNHSAARRLRGALHRSNGHHVSSSPGITLPLGTLSRLEPFQPGLAGVALSSPVRRDLAEVTLEWQRRGALAKAGIPRRTKLLIHGPPGNGKSLTARALAKEMQLPAFVARFDSIIGAFLGQTAVHLRQLFHFAETTPCLLLLDELDALGKARGNPLDVGELDRIVISLLQELEHCTPRGLVVATTNLPKHLDRALWRRFDAAFCLPAPRLKDRERYAMSVARTHNVPVTAVLRRKVLAAPSYADIEKVVESEARRRIVNRG